MKPFRPFSSMGFAFLLSISVLSQISAPLLAHAETYDERPSILDVKAQKHKKDANWEKLKEGHLEAVAQILGMYPDHKIYFLARDGELLYDLAKLFVTTTQSEADAGRIHLINVSRANMKDEHLKDYLEQEGIKEEELKKGQKVLFVDTGFAGTIPRNIQELYPENLRAQLQTQLMASANPAHPSSRAFLKGLNDAADSMDPSRAQGSILSYEYMPRYTHRATAFKQIKGKWQPWASDNSEANDGEVSKEKAMKYMEDMKEYGLEPATKDLYLKRRAFWDRFRRALEDAKHPNESENILRAELESKNPKAEAFVRDAIEITERNFSTVAKIPRLDSLELKPIRDGSFGNKNVLMKKYPAWKRYLEDPIKGVAALIDRKDFQTLRAILDVIEDKEFIQKALKKLAERSVDPDLTHEIEGTLHGIIKKQDESQLESVISVFFSNPLVHGFGKELQLLIEKAGQYQLEAFAKSVFSAPHSKDWGPQLQSLIEKADQEVLAALVSSVFSAPHSKDWGPQLQSLIAKGGQQVIRDLVPSVFSAPHSMDWEPQLQSLIAKGDKWVIEDVVRRAFNAPHSEAWGIPLQSLIDKGDKWVLLNLPDYVFSQPHSKNWTPQLESLIAKGDKRVHEEVVRCAFSKPHSEAWGTLLQSLIDKEVRNVEPRFPTAHVFFSPHSKAWGSQLQSLIDRGDRNHLICGAFNALHSKDWGPQLESLIAKGDQRVLNNLAEHSFASPHSKDWGHQLQSLIDKGDQDVLLWLTKEVFVKLHSKDWGPQLQALINKAGEIVLYSLAKSVFSAPHPKDWEPQLQSLIRKADKYTFEALIKSLEHLKKNSKLKALDPGLEDYLDYYIEATRRGSLIADAKERAEFFTGYFSKPSHKAKDSETCRQVVREMEKNVGEVGHDLAPRERCAVK